MRSLATRALLLAALTAGMGCSKKDVTTFPKLDAWQGTASIDVLSGGKTGTITVAKRGDTFRFEAPQHPEAFGSYGGVEGSRHFFFDAKARTLTLVVDASKQALDYDVTVLDGLSNKDTGTPFELAITGRKDTIAGHACDVWVGSDATTSVEACVVNQEAHAFVLGAGFLPANAAWAKTLLDGDHVPLSVIVKEGDAVTWKARLASIDQTVPQGSFEVPSDYERANFIDALKRVRTQQGK